MPVPHCPPLLATTATAHREVTVESPDCLFAISYQDEHVAIGTWSIPAEVTEAVSSLIGFLAPWRWDAIGISETVRNHAHDEPRRVTAVMDRTGLAATVDGVTGRLVHGAATITTDVLARSLGLSTPEPDATSAAWVEAIWLDQLATTVFGADRSLTWTDLAACHPLRSRFHKTPMPEELCQLTAEAAELNTWSQLRHGWVGPDHSVRPPDGTIISGSDWFDDGSFSRWLLRTMPPTADLFDDLSLLLPGRLASQLAGSLSAPLQ